MFEKLRLMTIAVVVYMNCDYSDSDTNVTIPLEFRGTHQEIIDRYYDRRKDWKTSNLGSILFKNANPEQYRNPKREKKTFLILIWKTWFWLKERHIDNFKGNSAKSDPLSGCSVRNCIFTGNHSLIDSADVVVIHSWASKNPDGRNRTRHQKWVFLSDESPQRLYTLRLRDLTYREIADQYNWTMTYRTFSDVPVPYGRTVPRLKPRKAPEKFEKLSLTKLIPHWFSKKMDVLAVFLASRKVSFRMRFVKELKKYMNVDMFGAVVSDHNNSICPGFFRRDCKILEQYLFYLSLENSRCRQYMTTHLFWNAYQKGAIPVILGPPLEDCEQLLPPKSFIHVEQFNSMEQLATHMKKVVRNVAILRGYHRWRNHFEIVNEHGYFESKSLHYCRLCEALNYNDNQVNTYCEYEAKTFFDTKMNCVNFEAPIFKPKWAEYMRDDSGDKCVSIKSESDNVDITDQEINDECSFRRTDSELITKRKEKYCDDSRNSTERKIDDSVDSTEGKVIMIDEGKYKNLTTKRPENEFKDEMKQNATIYNIPDDPTIPLHKKYECQNIESDSESEILQEYKNCMACDQKTEILEGPGKRNHVGYENLKRIESFIEEGTVFPSEKKIYRNRKSVEFKSAHKCQISECTHKPVNKKSKRSKGRHKKLINVTKNKTERNKQPDENNVTKEISGEFTTEYFRRNGNEKLIANQYFLERQNWKTSNLGSILFKNANATQFDQSSNNYKSYAVLYYIPKLPKGLARFKSRELSTNPLENCSVKNCVFTVGETITTDADAVVFHAIPKGLILPDAFNREPNQLWIFQADHADYNYFLDNKIKFNLIAGVFNWTMTLRSDADIPVPYGRTVALPAPLMSSKELKNTTLADLVPYWASKQRDVLVGIVAHKKARNHMISMVIKKLNSNDVKVDVISCDRTDSCDEMAKYLFYLVIEPMRCRQYISENLFYYTYAKGGIPVILGPPLVDCEKLLPPDSFIHVDQYGDMKNLAAHLNATARKRSLLRKYHKWRIDFSVVNEHGLFGPKKLQMCRLCEALNYNDRNIKIYYEDDLRSLFDSTLNCAKTFYKIFNVFKNVTNLNIYGDSVNSGYLQSN